MENVEGSDINMKNSDSAYSNSCSHSQSQGSCSSKSTHSGSNSSGSSGYGGEQSILTSSNGAETQNLLKRTKDKDHKKKKGKSEANSTNESHKPIEIASTSDKPHDGASCSNQTLSTNIQENNDIKITPQKENVDFLLDTIQEADKFIEEGAFEAINKVVTSLDTKKPSTILHHGKCDIGSRNNPENLNQLPSFNLNHSQGTSQEKNLSSLNKVESIVGGQVGFSCIVSMLDGIVMSTTSSLTAALGYPKNVWVGRSFIDYVHPKDRTFASQITTKMALPASMTQSSAQKSEPQKSTLFCRLRQYRGLKSGFGVKGKQLSYAPYLLRLSFVDINNSEENGVYLVVHATPVVSTFKVPFEKCSKVTNFMTRHGTTGLLDQVHGDSVPFWGYLPQDLIGKSMLEMYHPEDLPYLTDIYEGIVKQGNKIKTRPYRFLAQNGHFLKMETDWSSFINPWSRKVEFVIGYHRIVEGPENPDVFDIAISETMAQFPEELKQKAKEARELIVKLLNKVLTRSGEASKQQVSKQCQNMVTLIESLLEEQMPEEELKIDIPQDVEPSFSERESVMLGGISPHHEYSDSKSSTGTPVSYTQLNYNENLQRFFDSKPLNDQFDDIMDETNTQEYNKMPETPSELRKCLSPLQPGCGDSCESSISVGSNQLPLLVDTFGESCGSYNIRLTESLLHKHNSEMEKQIVKRHKETRSVLKAGDRENRSERREKKKEHLTRCNATLLPITSSHQQLDQPTMISGVKRQGSWEAVSPSKYFKHGDTHHLGDHSRLNLTTPNTTSISTYLAPQNATSKIDNYIGEFTMPDLEMNAYLNQIPQIPMPVMNPMPGVSTFPGVLPMYYLPPQETQMPQQHAGAPIPYPLQYMMYPSTAPIYGQPFMYPPLDTGVCYQSSRANLTAPTSIYGLIPQTQPTEWEFNSYLQNLPKSYNRSTETKAHLHAGSSTSQTEDIDGYLSSSSFYSSFLKTDSGRSAEDLNCPLDYGFKNNLLANKISVSHVHSHQKSGTTSCKGLQLDTVKKNDKTDANSSPSIANDQEHYKKFNAKDMDMSQRENPPWLNQVYVNKDLNYKYQIASKNENEVLEEDRLILSTTTQPDLVNEQLSQLYVDIELEGLSRNLSLEDGITSSECSEQENVCDESPNKKKHPQSTFQMIYEENASLPPNK